MPHGGPLECLASLLRRAKAEGKDDAPTTPDAAPQEPFCHTFDLTKKITLPSGAKVNHIPISPSPSPFTSIIQSITRSIEAELIPACRRYGLDIVVYNPVAGGLFSGKYSTTDVPEDGRFSEGFGSE